MAKGIKEMIQDVQNGLLDPLYATLGADLDYTPNSIDRLEERLNEMFPTEGERKPEMVVALGFYLGETLRRAVPIAKWNIPSNESVWDLNLQFDIGEGKGEANPFIRVDKFFKDRTDGLGVWFRMIAGMALGAINMDKANEGEWQVFPNGDRIRMWTAQQKGE